MSIPTRSGATERLKNLSEGVSSEVVVETVVVVGLGYVGLPLALLAANVRTHYRVLGIDVDPKKRSEIAARDVSDLDADLADTLKRIPLPVSGEFSSIHEADIVIICVPTPVNDDGERGNHQPDLTALVRATEAVAFRLEKGAMVLLESTVNPGVSEEILIPLLEEKSGMKAGIDFDYAHAPERINPGDKAWHPKKIARVVGGLTARSTERGAEFYRSILDAPVKEMANIKEAEAVKMVENAFRDVNIAFVNELAMSFSKLGIDIENVLDGASTKPFSFMRHSPGCGVGGHCIPVDPYYLISYAASNGFTHRFLSVARDINNQMPHFTVSLVGEALAAAGKELKGSRIALLGLAYKPGIGDLRESPAVEISTLLTDAGAVVHSYDPHVSELSTATSLDAALEGADVLLVATSHEEFLGITPELLKAHGIQLVVDGRNCLPKEEFRSAGIGYVGIGR